jgi:hypothetical protein
VPELSHRRKLARADLHIENVEALIRDWARDGYRISEETNCEGRTVVYANQLEPLPDQLPLVIGDALHCQRSSFDQLIYALSKKHSPRMTPKDEKDPAFPIYDNAVALTDKRIKHISPAAKRDVCDLAPNPAREPVNTNPLWVLNEMENRDKHREIPLTVSAAWVPVYILRASVGSDYFRSFDIAVLEVGADRMPICEFDRSPGCRRRDRRDRANTVRSDARVSRQTRGQRPPAVGQPHPGHSLPAP